MTDQRTVDLFDKFMDLARDFIVRHGLRYEDCAAVMQYMIRVSDAGEWPLWMDTSLENDVRWFMSLWLGRLLPAERR
ncbi:hypothetical protein [Streptomyces sp. CA-106110]|uniref:hypothetical protein n=1 Tax=Streptomyces sp. CA-106110 TaxID=3240044 RepID=UPI003D8A5E9E